MTNTYIYIYIGTLFLKESTLFYRWIDVNVLKDRSAHAHKYAVRCFHPAETKKQLIRSTFEIYRSAVDVHLYCTQTNPAFYTEVE